MIKIKVTDRIIKHCLQQIEKYNFGQRIEANGTKDQQLTGIIGQCVVMDLFDMPLIDGSDGFDNGIDILYDNNKIDVKTMGRISEAKPNYVNNFFKVQDYLNTNIYIFCSYHKKKKELTLCGWIDKEDFINKRLYYPKGSIRQRTDKTTFKSFADSYEIENHQLNNIESIDQLKKDLRLNLKQIQYRINKAKKDNKPIKISVGTINNPDKFVDSHLSILANNPQKIIFLPFYERLVNILKYYETNK